MKPDVIAQTLQLEKERAKMAEDAAAAAGGGGGQIILQQPGQEPVTLNNQQVVQIIQNLQSDLDTRNKEIEQLKEDNRLLKQHCESLLGDRLRAPFAPAPAPAPETVATSVSTDTETIFV